MSKTKRKPKRHIRYSATEILEQAQEAVEVWPVNDFETIDVYAHMPKNPKKKKKNRGSKELKNVNTLRHFRDSN